MSDSYGRVYALATVGEGIRYIGQTTNSVASRLADHLKPSACRNDYRGHWIQKALRNGDRPVAQCLAEAGSQAALDALEIAMIAAARALDYDLTNLDLGGNGTGKHSQATKDKLSRMFTGRKTGPSPLRGTRRPAEVVEKVRLSMVGKKRSPETCASNAASWTPERRAKQAEVGRRSNRKLTDEQIREILVTPRVRGSRKALAVRFGVCRSTVERLGK